MIENDSTNVFVAFEMLLEEIETEIDFINKVGARALEGRDYDGARESLERASQATTLRDKIVSLRKEWEALTVTRRGTEEEEIIRADRRNLGRLQRGMRTPETVFYQPILQALDELGGSAKMNEVLTRVERLMKGKLRQVDYQPLASDPEMLRWHNTAQWARNSMVKEGLLKPNSPRGIWEIAEAGRNSLR